MVNQVFEDGRDNVDDLPRDFLAVNIVADNRQEIFGLYFVVENGGVKHIENALYGDRFGD
jgi:hypothetical protein